MQGHKQRQAVGAGGDKGPAASSPCASSRSSSGATVFLCNMHGRRAGWHNRELAGTTVSWLAQPLPPVPPLGSRRTAQRTPRGWPLHSVGKWGGGATCCKPEWCMHSDATIQCAPTSHRQRLALFVVKCSGGTGLKLATQHRCVINGLPNKPYHLTLFVGEAQLREGLEPVAPPAPAVLLDEVQDPAGFEWKSQVKRRRDRQPRLCCLMRSNTLQVQQEPPNSRQQGMPFRHRCATSQSRPACSCGTAIHPPRRSSPVHAELLGAARHAVLNLQGKCEVGQGMCQSWITSTARSTVTPALSEAPQF